MDIATKKRMDNVTKQAMENVYGDGITHGAWIWCRINLWDKDMVTE